MEALAAAVIELRLEAIEVVVDDLDVAEGMEEGVVELLIPWTANSKSVSSKSDDLI
jgi:hypothetical protein